MKELLELVDRLLGIVKEKKSLESAHDKAQLAMTESQKKILEVILPSIPRHFPVINLICTYTREESSQVLRIRHHLISGIIYLSTDDVEIISDTQLSIRLSLKKRGIQDDSFCYLTTKGNIFPIRISELIYIMSEIPHKITEGELSHEGKE
jgi:hypothetical protein